MKKLFVMSAMAFAMVVSPAFCCDSQGSAEDCPDPNPDPWVRFSWPDPGGGGVICDINGCSSSWIRSLPVMEAPWMEVPLPSPDFPQPGSDVPPSNLKGGTENVESADPISAGHHRRFERLKNR
jgi:hypothetical protein